MYCLWPLPCLLLVCTTSVCVLFVATPTSNISVYYFSICTLLKYVYCLWPLPCLLLVCRSTTLVSVLFVATTTYTISVYYFCMCTVCGHSYVHVYCLWPVLFVCPTVVLVCILYTTPITLGNCTSQLPIHVFRQ